MNATVASKLSQPGFTRSAKLDHHNVMRCLQLTTTNQQGPGVVSARRGGLSRQQTRNNRPTTRHREAFLKSKLCNVVPSLRGTQILSLQVGYIVGSWHVLHQDLPILHLVFQKAFFDFEAQPLESGLAKGIDASTLPDIAAIPNT